MHEVNQENQLDSDDSLIHIIPKKHNRSNKLCIIEPYLDEERIPYYYFKILSAGSGKNARRKNGVTFKLF